MDDNAIAALNARAYAAFDGDDESLAYGECHDVALGAFEWAQRQGLDAPTFHTRGSHTYVTAGGLLIDIVAIAQPHLGAPFQPAPGGPLHTAQGFDTYASIDAYVASGARVNVDDAHDAAHAFADELDDALAG